MKMLPPAASYSTRLNTFNCIVASLSMLAHVSAYRLPDSLPPGPPPPPQKRETNYGYYIPMDGGGSMLTQVPDTYPAGLGEPINAILSAYSDSEVLQTNANTGGMINYFQSIGFSTECLGQHSGSDQAADLGDGNGYLNETAVIRWDYGNANFGTCQETIEGGNHFRYWVQNGAQANSGAIFMAVSYEMPIADQHNIVPNGYNFGRDWLVGNATAQPTIVPTANLTNTTSYTGQTTFNNYTYSTTVDYVSGLLQNSSQGINHFQSVAVDGQNAIDGLVAILTVKVLSMPAATSGAEWSNRPMSLCWTLFVLLCSLIAVSSI